MKRTNYHSENLLNNTKYGTQLKIPNTSKTSNYVQSLGLDLGMDDIANEKLPYAILTEIAKTIKIPDYLFMEADELTVKISAILGVDQREWSYLVQSKYKNEDLGVKIYASFKPKLWNPRDNWLGEGDISDLLNLFSQKNELSFHNYHPVSAGHTFTENNIKKKIRHGFVINTSGKYNNGSHWVAMYVDLRTKNLEYFDSFGCRPSEGVEHTLTSIVTSINQKFPEREMGTVVKYNAKQKQRDSNQCGVWCILFIVSRIKGKSLREFADLNITDSDCQKLKSYLFQM
jgi:hypothetical protein